MVILVFLFFAGYSSGGDLPPFFDAAEQASFFPDGMGEWKLKTNVKQGNDHLLEWKNASRHEMTLRYRAAGPNTITAVYKGMGEEIDRKIKQTGGTILILKEFFAVIQINDTRRKHSVNLLYGTPAGVYFWTYKVPNTFGTDHGAYIAALEFAARKHQYDTALKYGNVVMGRWGGPVHEFARLLAQKKDPRAESVYRILLQTSSSNYEAQIEYAAITEDSRAAEQSARIVERGAEEESLLSTAADILNKDIPELSSYPLIGPEDKGLKVILIPMAPCNPWILEEISKIYEKITTIPVSIRRLPIDPPVLEPSRSVYRPYLEQIASNIWKTKSDYSEWSLSTLKSNIMKQAEKEGPQSVISIRRLFEKMDETGYQWDAVPIVDWLSKEVAPYFSGDPEIMVVGITGLDIYSGEANFVFSLYGGLEHSPVSVLSYAKMRAKLTGEKQSRKRLMERTAKELVPASLKKLKIPRSMDPFCPYSYSSGLQRLEEKTLNLSEPVKMEIEKIKNSIR